MKHRYIRGLADGISDNHKHLVYRWLDIIWLQPASEGMLKECLHAFDDICKLFLGGIMVEIIKNA